MPNKMLEYCKTILQKISFSKPLFKKEYKKSFKYLDDGERRELKKWLKANVLKISHETKKMKPLPVDAADLPKHFDFRLPKRAV